MSNEYIKQLAVNERAATLKIAMAAVLTGAGIPITKTAAAGNAAVAAAFGIPGLGMSALKTVAAISLIAGVPIGAALHAVSRSAKVSSNKERASLNRIDRYRAATESLEDSLGRRNII
jgi:hypothetical protein